MFKRSGGRQTGGFFQLPDQLPAIKGIQKIDVSGSAGEYLDRKIAPVFHVDAGWFLIGVASVF